METASSLNLSAEEARVPWRREGTPRSLLLTPGWGYVLSGVLTLIFFAADVVLPRGATAAIAFCLVPAVAAATRRRGFVIGMTLLCTVLTWIAFFTESQEYSGWKSAFDRSMVSAVLWLALILVLRRAEVMSALRGQTRALEEMTAELERSNIDLERFASVVAHDLRGPLNTISLLAEVVAGAPAVASDSECRESLGALQSAVTRMSRLIQSLLAYAHVGSGQISAQAVCDCGTVLEDVRKRLKADLDRQGAQVTAEGLPVLRGDPVLIGELFQNLIENSIKYRGAMAPRIHISAAPHSEGWQFCFQDNGIGIRPQDQQRIFEAFQRGTGAGSEGGVGLGLATCRRIVERHGGRIEARTGAGAGATFVFTLAEEASAAGR
jgi:signal transduction histidine kinase